MHRITGIPEMKKAAGEAACSGKTIGLVPTMGYLHEGHLSLVRRSLAENDMTIVSIFVNPSQFGPGEDLDMYPRDMDRDMSLLEETGNVIVFAPGAEEMYPDGYDTYVEVGSVSQGMCAVSRPTHFRGVATVVLKLFNICRPDRAYFGQKDFQQTVVIKKMIRDLDIDTKMTVCPTVREYDGLAMSSRNKYLTEEQRKIAPVIYKALSEARMRAGYGEKNCGKLIEGIRDTILAAGDIRIDYIDIRSADTLDSLASIDSDAVIAAAVFLGGTRLIDNVIAEVDPK